MSGPSGAGLRRFLPSWQNVRSLSVRIARSPAGGERLIAFIPSLAATVVVAAPSARHHSIRRKQRHHAGRDSTLRHGDLLTAILDQLAGVRVPASALGQLILPARVPGYQPHMLDELIRSPCSPPAPVSSAAVALGI